MHNVHSHSLIMEVAESFFLFFSEVEDLTKKLKKQEEAVSLKFMLDKIRKSLFKHC